MNEKSRRDFLKTVAAGGAALTIAPHLVACGSEEGLGIGEDGLDEASRFSSLEATNEHDKKLFNKYFKVEVKGVYGEVPGVQEIDPGRCDVTVEETTQGDQPEYRTYTYGSHEYEDLVMTLQVGPGMVKLQKWAAKAMQVGGAGNTLRRDISVYCLARDKKTVLKTINCFGCYPISLNRGSPHTGSDVKTITLTCKVSRIEVA